MFCSWTSRHPNTLSPAGWDHKQTHSLSFLYTILYKLEIILISCASFVMFLSCRGCVSFKDQRWNQSRDLRNIQHNQVCLKSRICLSVHFLSKALCRNLAHQLHCIFFIHFSSLYNFFNAFYITLQCLLLYIYITSLIQFESYFSLFILMPLYFLIHCFVLKYLNIT